MGALAGGVSTSAGTRSARRTNPAEYRCNLFGIASVEGCGACRTAISRHRSTQRVVSAVSSHLSPQRDGRRRLGAPRRALEGFRGATKSLTLVSRRSPSGISDVAFMIGMWVYLDVMERRFT